jgi:hypothetical protein
VHNATQVQPAAVPAATSLVAKHAWDEASFATMEGALIVLRDQFALEEDLLGFCHQP